MFRSGRPDQKPRLYLLGAGVSFPEHLTLQTLDILGACNRICSNLPQSDLDLLPNDLRIKCRSLWPIYQENRNRSDNYEDVSRAVLEAADNEPPVAWLTPGHPLIFDSVSQSLLKSGRDRGWNVQVTPAISSIDTILAEVGYDPANGLLVDADETYILFVELNRAQILRYDLKAGEKSKTPIHWDARRLA